MSVRSVFGITCLRSSSISDSVLSSCFPGARIDLSTEDNAIALALAECSSRPYAELIKSDIPGPSSSRSARSVALRPSPPSTTKVSPVGPSAANPTRGELLVQLETLSRKPQSVKRKTPGSAEKDRPVLAKVPNLGVSLSSPSAPIKKSERAQLPPAEAPTVSSSQPHSRSAVKAKSLLGGTVEQPLAVIPLNVWNLPTKSVMSPSRRAEELKRKDPELKIGGDGDSLLLNAELAAGVVSSILRDSDLERSKALPIDEALALSLQGVASVSSYILSCLFPF